MRKLPIVTAITHALQSVITYRMAGLRIGGAWMILLFALSAAELLFIGLGTEDRPSNAATAAELLSAAAGLLAFSSIAVGWHRFILKDELPAAVATLRVDGLVLRYLGNSLLALLGGAVPLAAVAIAVAFLPQIAVLLLLPAALVAGAFIMMLSLKLPAVALGRGDFTFGHALKAAEGNQWQILGVFLLNAAIILIPGLLLTGLVLLLRQLGPGLATAVGLILSVPLNLFFTLFSVSVLTSLYGFFVEKREF